MEVVSIKQVSFIGAGNVAYNLAPALFKAGIRIQHIISRNQPKAQRLATMLNADASTDISVIDKSADAVFLTLPDDVILDVAERLASNNNFSGLVIHTSGSTALDDLLQTGLNAGVFYPLQSFTRDATLNFKEIPVCIEGGNEHITHALEGLARLISDDVRQITSAQRAIIHLGAVFASNFTNHLYARAFDILRQSGVEPSILLPLIKETAKRLNCKEPVQLQTGPAVRGDKRIMNKHLDMLTNDAGGTEIYRLFSELIQLLQKKEMKNE
ncbi:MAG: DUF2520 domain-containing protein [Lentimicrobiaceae bacterium]|nr:DUF2520 domain-containing protein [Lentimicrobiaceae bacterium]